MLVPILSCTIEVVLTFHRMVLYLLVVPPHLPLSRGVPSLFKGGKGGKGRWPGGKAEAGCVQSLQQGNSGVSETLDVRKRLLKLDIERTVHFKYQRRYRNVLEVHFKYRTAVSRVFKAYCTLPIHRRAFEVDALRLPVDEARVARFRPEHWKDAA
ncbi:hypothetical protein NQZ68_012794 [Dissostichus eleginoides]|nr:hypothetical protein NQZ68_012794 [Dissostichus eleginoides]